MSFLVGYLDRLGCMAFLGDPQECETQMMEAQSQRKT